VQGALEALPPDDSALRARASALLGLRLDPLRDQARREALLDDGVAMARRLGDDDVLVSVLTASALVNRSPERATVRAAAIDEVLGRAARGADLASVFWARTLKLRDALEAGELASVDEELDRLARLTAESRRTYYRWCLLVLQAARALFAGRLADGERLAEEAVELNRRLDTDPDQEYTVQRLALSLARRRPQDAPLGALRDYAVRYPGLPVWHAMLAQAEHGMGSAGARRTVDACARDGFSAVIGTHDSLSALVLLAEPVAALGSPEQLGQVANALAPHAERNAVVEDAWAAFGPVARPLGVLAAAAGRHEEAARHFERAVALSARWGAPGWELAAIADWARSGAPGAPLGHGLALARDLELPWVAVELDRSQTTTP
jgi:tetratricopeptide (TPR) repeat protein